MKNTDSRSSFFLSRRKILIVEDNELNRNILAAILEDDYDLLFAENGKIGLDIIREHADISLILLDVYMPVCSGFEFLEQIRKQESYSGIPIIVTTGSDVSDDEIRCLNLGASDFVKKPYNTEVVMARVRNFIKLKESLVTLSVVEFDGLTGVYTLPAFILHAEELIRTSSAAYDLILCDIKNFKLINSMFGEKTGDSILLRMSDILKNRNKRYLIARNGDKFVILMPSAAEFDMKIADDIQRECRHCSDMTTITVKFGHYKNIARDSLITGIYDKAKIALSKIMSDSSCYALYDSDIEKKLLRTHAMEEHFEDALRNNEFVVWFQPKVDSDTGVSNAAEALVRWRSSEGRMTPPGEFIPLFEKNGMISRLDEFVFRYVCRFLKNRIQKGKSVVPISVNLSRNSLYKPGTPYAYKRIISDEGIPMSLVPLEVTESASAGETTEMTWLLKELGFSLQMDDFGTGFSSLSNLVSMPFDVIKLDRSLINHIGNAKGELLLRSMADIARKIGMNLVAEGVECKEQVDFLKKIGCNQIQGFYYYRPMDESAFTELLDSTVSI